jgi:hypothetical protein
MMFGAGKIIRTWPFLLSQVVGKRLLTFEIEKTWYVPYFPLVWQFQDKSWTPAKTFF